MYHFIYLADQKVLFEAQENAVKEWNQTNRKQQKQINDLLEKIKTQENRSSALESIMKSMTKTFDTYSQRMAIQEEINSNLTNVLISNKLLINQHNKTLLKHTVSINDLKQVPLTLAEKMKAQEKVNKLFENQLSTHLTTNTEQQTTIDAEKTVVENLALKVDYLSKKLKIQEKINQNQHRQLSAFKKNNQNIAAGIVYSISNYNPKRLA